MQFRFQSLIHFGVVLAIGLVLGLGANAQTPPPSDSTATLHGHVTDPTGALIPGAMVKITTSAGTAVTSVNSDASGAYEVHSLSPGGYIVTVNYQGFAAFQSQTITLAPGQVKRVDVAMAIETEQQNVVVTDETPTVNIEAGGNSNAVVIKGKDLDALSDDPDELSNELQALAGPSAGPNGGQIYIDGFTGGQLPPKSAIREIRINQNPFSAEFDRLGYGRIEILTKPGTDKLHGQVFAMGNYSGFNTGDPFVKSIPPYNRIQYNGTISGSLNKKASFFLSVEQRDNHDQQIFDFTPSVAGTCDFGYGVFSNGNCSGTEANPHNHINVSPRLDLQLGQTNTLTLRYQFYYDSESGDITAQELPTQSVDTTSKEHTFQLSDSQIINDHTVNETRLEYRRELSSDVPSSTLPTITVTSNFTGGGTASQTSTDHQDHFELQNYTTMSLGRHALKFGAWLRDNRDANASYADRNGSVIFTAPGYVDAVSKLASGQNLNTLADDVIKVQVSAGRAAYVANVFDGALFVQDDWKFNPRLTLSGGLRWETQNHIADHNDWAPRVAMAYALDAKGNKPAKTVLRAGYGIFYDRVQIANVLAATEQSANAGQVQVTTSSPSCLSATSLTSIDFSGCLPAQPYKPGPDSTIVEIAPGFHAPYTHQVGASIERQVTKTITGTITYLRSFGVHQVVTRDANAYEPLPGTTFYNETTGPRPDPSLGIVNEYFPEAVYKQNQMILNVNARISPRFNVFGFYNLSYANTDGAGGTVSNSYNIRQDYGRAGFVSRNMVFLMANYTGPWALRFNPFIIARSGRPYNVAVGEDLTGDNFINDRPALADSSDCSAPNPQFVSTTQYGCLNLDPGPADKLLPINLGNSPTSVAINLRVSRAFGIGPKLEEGAQSGPNRGGDGGGYRGGGRGAGGGGFGPGGFGGGGGPRGMFGPEGGGRKYNLTFSAQALNLFNNINYGTPTGSISPAAVTDSSGTVTGYVPDSLFGHSRALAGQMFSQGAASRRVFLQAVFTF
ncbi:MAG TPA: carboxypeptidase regulatory-like domain-containing protein [Terracidiphilus sp.]|nr:carboxypeptidase regulatory-like domain-containing protein [Terracidiphilus sp.]